VTTSAILPPQERQRLGLPVDPPQDPIGSWRAWRAQLLAWLSRHRRSLTIVLPLFVVVAAVRLWGIGHGPALSDDEGTYVAQAWAVQVRHTLAPYTYWYDHPPFGWIQIAVWTWITGVFHGNGLDIVAVRRFMVGYAVIDAGLIYVLARRFGSRRTFAAVAVALWALSPLAVGYSRMVYLDNLALPWILASFVLAATPRRSLWAQVGAGACFAAGVLSKESMVILLPALAWIVWRNTNRKTRSFCLVGFASTGLLVLAIYPLLAVLRGELLPGHGHVSLVEALKWQFLTRPSSGSALHSGSGARVLLDQWLSLDGWLLGLGIAGAVGCLFVRRLRPLAATVLILVAIGLRPGYLPQPYVIALLPFAALAAAGAADAAVTGLRERPPVPVRPTARRDQLLTRWGRLGLLAVAVAVLAGLVPTWIRGNQALADTDQSAPVANAEHWLEQHAVAATRGPHGHDVLVDDTMWSDLVAHGMPQSRVVWFYKLDFVDNLDPSVRRRIHDYRDFRYVVLTPIIRNGLAQTSAPTYSLARQAIAHSKPVASFGTGAQRIEIRRVSST
jgi:Dolichyl-phosphate-mannose-protein mannosyltransferase